MNNFILRKNWMNIIDDTDCFLPDGSTVLVTGAAGLIGSEFVKFLLCYKKIHNINIKIIAVVRNYEKTLSVFAGMLKDTDDLDFIVGSIENFTVKTEKIDYIIHAASNTSSKAFVNNPVEVINTAVNGTLHVLEIAKDKQIKKMIFLSTMEVYGYPKKGELVNEYYVGRLSSLNVRNSYPLSKMMCENICVGYCSEFDVPVVVARLTQTFGAGVDLSHDQRIFAYIARCIMNHENIILKTEGKTERCYCSISDAISGLLYLLNSGVSGEAYNVSSDNTYCSIADMCELVASKYDINVKYDIQDISASGFADTLYMNLDNAKLKALGWKSRTNSILDIFEDMLNELYSYVERIL